MVDPKPLRILTSIALLVFVAACGTIYVPKADGSVYHCFGTSTPTPPANTRYPNRPLKYFEYGNSRTYDKPTVGTSYECGFRPIPEKARIGYFVDGRLIEKEFDLTGLTPFRVFRKSLVLFVDQTKVELQLITRNPGTWPTIEVIDVQ